jgi:glutathione S-transferase
MSFPTPESNNSLRLFTSPSVFPNPQRLRIFLHEKGIADQFDERIYDMTSVGEQRQWRHLKMNPWIVTAFHVLHQGLGPKLELTTNHAWGEHCRKEALAHASLVNQHLSDGRSWLLGGDEPTFSDITMATAIAFSKFQVNAMPLDERFEHIDAFRRRWLHRPTFLAAYADRNSGVPELDTRA